jgi:hypothetical protein
MLKASKRPVQRTSIYFKSCLHSSISVDLFFLRQSTMRPPPEARLEQYCMMSLLHFLASPCRPLARLESLPDARYAVKRHRGMILSSYEMRHATRRSLPGDTLEQKFLRSLAQSTAKAACALAVRDPPAMVNVIASGSIPTNIRNRKQCKNFCKYFLPSERWSLSERSRAGLAQLV